MFFKKKKKCFQIFLLVHFALCVYMHRTNTSTSTSTTTQQQKQKEKIKGQNLCLQVLASSLPAGSTSMSFDPNTQGPNTQGRPWNPQTGFVTQCLSLPEPVSFLTANGDLRDAGWGKSNAQQDPLFCLEKLMHVPLPASLPLSPTLLWSSQASALGVRVAAQWTHLRGPEREDRADKAVHVFRESTGLGVFDVHL